MGIEALSDELNAEQRAAVEHDDRPLLVLAGAGTGKTTTLAARVAHLVERGADPQRLLLMTFSRRAAAEMAHRAGRMLHAARGLPAHLGAPTLPWCGTFHSVAARLLREMAPRIGLDAGFGVLDAADAAELMGQVRQRLGFAAGEQRFPLPATCGAIHSRAVNGGIALGDLLVAAYPWCAMHEASLAELFTAYHAEKRRQRLLDFDDLLLLWRAALDEPSIGPTLRSRFDHVLVDEYQDTNPLQAAIVKALAPDGRGLTVVGDDAQAIYSFRGATIANIAGFARRFDPPAQVVALTRNHRSTNALLAAANAVLRPSREVFPKVLTGLRPDAGRPQIVSVDDEAAQARCVADSALARREEGLALRRQAVLFRTAHHSAALELELLRRNIPFVKYGGLRFFEAAHVKDLLALLRWAANPRCRLAGSRVLRLVPGIGPARSRVLLDAMDAAEEPRGVLEAFRAPPSATAAWAGFASAWRDIVSSRADWPAPLDRALAWYRPQLDRLYDDVRSRAAELDQLVRLGSTAPSLDAFLTDLALDPPAAAGADAGEPLRDEDYLVLSTIHSAKGQEWTAVHVLNVVDGCIPSDMATGSEADIEEERRLLHVAMTRARDHLALMVPLRFHVTQQRRFGDRHLYAPPSRFLDEGVRACCDEIGVVAEPLASVDLGARLALPAWSG